MGFLPAAWTAWSVIALVLLAAGVGLVIYLWSRIRRTLLRFMRKPDERGPPA